MQAGKSDKPSSSAPPSLWLQSNTDRGVTPAPLLPVTGYHDKISITTMPIVAISLPAELIRIIQGLCSFQDLLTLTSIDKAAFALRFDNLPRQHLHFKTTADVEQFLSYCRNAQGNLNPKDMQKSSSGLISAVWQYFAKPRRGVFSLEHLQGIRTLSLTLSNQLTVKQCEELFACLPGVNCLNICLTSDHLHIASLAPLLIAVQNNNLLHLNIGRSGCFNCTDTGTTLPEELWNLVTLKTLKLRHIQNVQYIPEKIGQLKALTSLELSYMDSLRALPASLWRLNELEQLALGKLDIESIPEEIVQLKALKSLKLKSAGSLNALPASLWRLNKIEQLVLEGLKIKSISEGIGQLTALKSLKLKDISWLNALPASLWQLNKLERLVLRGLEIESISEEIGQLTALKVLRLESMIPLKALPVSLGRLGKLEVLALHYLLKIRELPEEIGQLTALESLDLTGMWSLKALPESLANLENLREISINNTPELYIPPALGQDIERV